MPIWFELITLLLFTYMIGLGLGWLLWARAPQPGGEPTYTSNKGDL
ncbi:hypothetical protein [Parerythrobacter aestuarii]|nr:hypothetical protein [Parerythrobacter aestuarii]